MNNNKPRRGDYLDAIGLFLIILVVLTIWVLSCGATGLFYTPWMNQLGAVQ